MKEYYTHPQDGTNHTIECYSGSDRFFARCDIDDDGDATCSFGPFYTPEEARAALLEHCPGAVMTSGNIASNIYKQMQPGKKTIDISDFAEDYGVVGWGADLCFFEGDDLARRMTDGHGKHYLFIYEDYETDDDGECEPDDWDAPSYITFEGVGDDFSSDDDNPNSDCPYYPV